MLTFFGGDDFETLFLWTELNFPYMLDMNTGTDVKNECH